MPPKVTDIQPAADNSHTVEENTALAARRVVSTYAEDFLDGVTLMSMLGVEPKGLVHKKVLAEQAEEAPQKATKKSTKKATKGTKKSTKKATKKASKKATKKATKKASKKATKKSTTKAAKKTTKKA